MVKRTLQGLQKQLELRLYIILIHQEIYDLQRAVSCPYGIIGSNTRLSSSGSLWRGNGTQSVHFIDVCWQHWNSETWKYGFWARQWRGAVVWWICILCPFFLSFETVLVLILILFHPELLTPLPFSFSAFNFNPAFLTKKSWHSTLQTSYSSPLATPGLVFPLTQSPQSKSQPLDSCKIFGLSSLFCPTLLFCKF